MAMPQCCYLAKGASHTTIMLTATIQMVEYSKRRTCIPCIRRWPVGRFFPQALFVAFYERVFVCSIMIIIWRVTNVLSGNIIDSFFTQ